MSQWMLVPPLAALLFAWPGNAAAQAQALEVTTEEAGAGAAAVSVIALRCQPDAFVAIKKQAFEYLAVRLRDLSAEERERVLDAAERKLRALTVASDRGLAVVRDPSWRAVAGLGLALLGVVAVVRGGRRLLGRSGT